MSEAEAAIRELEEAGRRATIENDIPWHRQNLDDGWLSINANGSLTRRPQLLRLMDATPFRFESIEDTEVAVRAFGSDLAIVTGVSTRRRLTTDRREVAVVRFARTYRLSGGRWRLMLSCQTPLA